MPFPPGCDTARSDVTLPHRLSIPLPVSFLDLINATAGRLHSSIPSRSSRSGFALSGALSGMGLAEVSAGPETGSISDPSGGR